MVVIKAEVLGTREIVRALRALPLAARKRVFRSVLPKAGRVAQKKAKKTAPKQSGTLQKSIGTRAYTRLDEVGAVVGPKSKAGRYVAVESHRKGKRYRLATSAAGARALGKGSTELVFRRPVKYAHLMEKGTKHISPRIWLFAAFVRTEAQTARIIKTGLKVAVERETRKLSARTKK